MNLSMHTPDDKPTINQAYKFLSLLSPESVNRARAGLDFYCCHECQLAKKVLKFLTEAPLAA